MSTSKRRRLAVVAGIVAGTLLVAAYQAWQRRPSALRNFHEWGPVTGSGVLNAVRRVGEFDRERGRFSYYTGARSGDVGPLTRAPTRVVAEAAHGAVTVRLLAFDAYEHPRAEEDAVVLARIVPSATTELFPAVPIPVEIDYHFMPENARFSLAKRVDWREGSPYALAVFARERSFTPTTAAHELYHVLATRWSLRGTPQATRRPGAASSYEEAAAELYAECGALLANETLPRKALERNRVTIKDPVLGDRVFEGVLTGDELVDAFDSLRNGANGAGFIGFGPLLANTMLDEVFAGADTMTLESPQGATLAALCKDAAADPFAIEARLAGLLPSPVDADVPEAPAD